MSQDTVAMPPPASPVAGVPKRNPVKAALGSDKDIIVIKVGTSSILHSDHDTLNLGILARLCETVKTLTAQGHHVIIVSSGAVGVGCQRLGLATKPQDHAKKQACAAVGQLHLMRYYEDFMAALGMRCAQVLLTLDNLANRAQYLNARNTFTELLAYGVVPVVNENDTVACQEPRFGDNDTLSAQVATLVQADWLFLMTDVDCLYTSNPKEDPNAQPIYEVHDMGALRADTSTQGTQWGTGGMTTKLTAGRIATAAGCTMVICSSSSPEVVVRVLAGDRVGTKFYPVEHALRGRYRWILSVPVRGQLWLDAGAVRALKSRRKRASLFAVGINKVSGAFNAQDAVSLCDGEGVEFARGLVNFTADEVRELRRLAQEKGCSLPRSASVNGALSDGGATGLQCKTLAYKLHAEVVHRSFLSLLVGQCEDTEDESDHHTPHPAPRYGTHNSSHPAVSSKVAQSGHTAVAAEGGVVTIRTTPTAGGLLPPIRSVQVNVNVMADDGASGFSHAAAVPAADGHVEGTSLTSSYLSSLSTRTSSELSSCATLGGGNCGMLLRCESAACPTPKEGHGHDHMPTGMLSTSASSISLTSGWCSTPTHAAGNACGTPVKGCPAVGGPMAGCVRTE